MEKTVDIPSARHAQARSAVYALFSRLVASPFDAPSLAQALPPADLAELAGELRARLPYSLDLAPVTAIAAELEEGDAERLAAEFSGLFEVTGAPVPLREELSPSSTDKAKEETLRFYQFFGYTLAEDRQWAPDHLSVQLEFMHFLSFKESEAGDPEHLASYRLAQRDFLERHLCHWYPEILKGVRRFAKEPYWLAVFSGLGELLPTDADWLRQTATEAG